MAFITLTDQSPGAPTLNGVNGSLCAVLDWALPQVGWAIEYSQGNARVYRPALGNRHRLHVNHDSTLSGSAALAVVRGCEDATSATDLIDPFPTVSQSGNTTSTFAVSSGASTTARPYRVVATDTFLIVLVATSSLNNAGWDVFLFGDVVGRYANDIYGTIIQIGGNPSTNTPSRAMSAMLSSAYNSGARTYWCRSIDGFVKSSSGVLYGSVSSASAVSPCNVGNAPALRSGYLAEVVRERIGATCFGSKTATVNPSLCVLNRGWVPFIWNPIHGGIGTMTSDDTFGDAAYHPGAQFVLAPAGSSGVLIVEITNTWSAPNG